VTEVLDIVPGVAPWTFAGLTVLSFFTAAFGVVAGLGGGVFLLAVMATIFPPATLIPLHGAVLFGSNIGRAIIMRGHVLVHLIAPFAAGAVIGGIAGGQLVVALPTAILQIILAIFIVYVCWAPTPPPARAGSRARFAILGFAGMFLGMFIGSSGSLIAPFVAAACPDRRQYVATHALLMSMAHGLKIAVFGMLGFALADYLPLVAAMIATAFLGNVFGRHLLNRVPEKIFRRVFQVVLTLLAIRLLYAGIRGAGWV
jgi:uncharacterized membrane protein YfcA